MNSWESNYGEDKILEEIHRIREEHAKAFNYDIRALCKDWQRRQAQGSKQFVTLTPAKHANKPVQGMEQK